MLVRMPNLRAMASSKQDLCPAVLCDRLQARLRSDLVIPGDHHDLARRPSKPQPPSAIRRALRPRCADARDTALLDGSEAWGLLLT